MIVAQVSGYVSRPVAPTRRIALGTSTLPTDGPEQFGAVLIGGMAAEFGPTRVPTLTPHLPAPYRTLNETFQYADRLIDAITHARRVVQPAMRHRLQVDRVGLAPVTYRLVRSNRGLRLAYRQGRSTPQQALLLALYACGEMAYEDRSIALALFRRGLAHTSGVSSHFLLSFRGAGGGYSSGGYGDRQWAMRMLGLSSDLRGTRDEVQSAYRRRLVEVHPDHGGDSADAPERIAAIGEARRILLYSSE